MLKTKTVQKNAYMRISESKVKRQQHKIVINTQTIRRLLPKNYLSVFDHFFGVGA